MKGGALVAALLAAGPWLPAAAACTVSASSQLAPPAAVMRHMSELREIDSLDALPAGIADGTFGGDRGGIAAPGARWSATDVPAPYPPRRLFFAACGPAVCVVHYEWGGIARTNELLALVKASAGWKVVWHASGSKPVATLSALIAVLENRSPQKYYTVSDVTCY